MAGVGTLLVCLALALCGCSRGTGSYRLGYPGGIRLALPITLSPGDWFAGSRGGRGDDEDTSPLQAAYEEKIHPAFESSTFLGEAARLRSVLSGVQTAPAQGAAAMAFLRRRGIRYQAGPTDLKRMRGEDASPDGALSPTQVLAFQSGGTDDLTLLVAALLHSVGCPVGLTQGEADALFLLLRCEDGEVLLLDPSRLSAKGFFEGAQWASSGGKGESEDDEDDAERFWFDSPPLAKQVQAEEDPILCQGIATDLVEAAQEAEDGRLQEAVLNHLPRCAALPETR